MQLHDFTKSPVIDAIFRYHKQKGDSEQTRGYLGMSEIGHPCSRYLWFKFRNCIKSNISGRVYRLFETGNLAEQRFIEELKAIGCEVHDRDEQGDQFSCNDFGGHFSGHMDGCAKGLPGVGATFHVLEFKTHNDKSFTKLSKEGVKAAKPQHYCQCQCYMHYSGMTRALYLAVNKNDESLYAQRVHYNKEEALDLVYRAKNIITSVEPLPRLSDRPDYYECKWCDAHDICHGCDKALPLPMISCRQCCYATPLIDQDGAKWKCEKGLDPHKADMPVICDKHLCLPGLFPYAEPTDYTDGMICFKNKDDGKEWQHGGFCYSTKELMEKTREEL